jgi:hypothetical protein
VKNRSRLTTGSWWWTTQWCGMCRGNSCDEGFALGRLASVAWSPL